MEHEPGPLLLETAGFVQLGDGHRQITLPERRRVFNNSPGPNSIAPATTDTNAGASQLSLWPATENAVDWNARVVGGAFGVVVGGAFGWVVGVTFGRVVGVTAG
ncbi:MAG: hypothetical protein ABSB54_13495, partial [Acidimicrobiales bacterium]